MYNEGHGNTFHNCLPSLSQFVSSERERECVCVCERERGREVGGKESKRKRVGGRGEGRHIVIHNMVMFDCFFYPQER